MSMRGAAAGVYQPRRIELNPEANRGRDHSMSHDTLHTTDDVSKRVSMVWIALGSTMWRGRLAPSMLLTSKLLSFYRERAFHPPSFQAGDEKPAVRRQKTTCTFCTFVLCFS
jgi:hypothetical protein